MAFYQLEPFGTPAADTMTAMQMCLMANLWSKNKSKPIDFLTFPEPKEPQTENEMKNILKMYERALKQGNK